MTPIAEPLINNPAAKASKTASYWGATSGGPAPNNDDGGQTEHLKDTKKSVTNMGGDVASQGTTAGVVSPYQPNQFID